MKKSDFGRYGIDFGKLVRQLTPYWLRGKNLILYLQACMHPLQALSDQFRLWADQKRIEVSMTSQKIMMEWYLNRMFGGTFHIDNFSLYSNALYHYAGHSPEKRNMPCYSLSVASVAVSMASPVYFQGEDAPGCGASFIVTAPLSLVEKRDEIARIIDRYKLVNKTYKIIFK